MDLQLRDKVIVITGGAKGIGAAITRGCAHEGALPIVVDKDSNAGQQLVSGLRASGAQCKLIAGDLMQRDVCEAAIAQTQSEFGRIDALVNNAGMNDGIGLEQGSPEEFLASLQANLLHYYNMAHYALSALKKSQGSIVNVASKVAVTGQGNTSGYA